MADAQAVTDALAERVELAIGGKLYAGWTDVTIERRLDAMSGQFTLTLASKEKSDAAEFPVHEGDRCEVRIAGEVVINGWVDAVSVSIDSNDHSVTVAGRDRSGDLADCSAMNKPGSWTNAMLEAIAADLASPFGISVTARVSTGAAIRKFALQQGESVQAAIDRLLRFRGLIAVPTATGDIEITTPQDSAPVAVLALGKNIVSIEVSHDSRERFSDYLIKGQAAGSDDASGKTVSAMSGDAQDKGVARYRPLLIVAEEQGTAQSLKTRAAFEAGVRAGRGVTAEVTLLGWRVVPKGALWRPNVQVRVQCGPAQLPDDIMLVSAITLKKGEDGTFAVLTANPPGAWAQLAEPEDKAA